MKFVFKNMNSLLVFTFTAQNVVRLWEECACLLEEDDSGFEFFDFVRMMLFHNTFLIHRAFN